MTRLNIILFVALILSGLGLVNAQHKARNLYFGLEQLNQAAKQYEQEYGLLQLEQSTWAMHSRIEEIATQELQMQVPDAKRVQVVTLDKTIPSDKPILSVTPKITAPIGQDEPLKVTP